MRKANQALVELPGKIAKRKGATPARLDENNGAAEVELTHDDLREIESGCSEIQVQGERLPEMHMELIDR